MNLDGTNNDYNIKNLNRLIKDYNPESRKNNDNFYD